MNEKQTPRRISAMNLEITVGDRLQSSTARLFLNCVRVNTQLTEFCR